MNQQIRRRFPFKKNRFGFRNTEWILIRFLRCKMIHVLSEYPEFLTRNFEADVIELFQTLIIFQKPCVCALEKGVKYKLLSLLRNNHLIWQFV